MNGKDWNRERAVMEKLVNEGKVATPQEFASAAEIVRDYFEDEPEEL